jgi:hypothetical protein
MTTFDEIIELEPFGDPKRAARIKDPELMRQAHWAFDECVICGGIDITIHHVLSRGQGGDDVWENLVALCGSGTHGCHGNVEGGLESACRALGRHLQAERPDTLDYLRRRLGSAEAAGEFLRRRLRVSS